MFSYIYFSIFYFVVIVNIFKEVSIGEALIIESPLYILSGHTRIQYRDKIKPNKRFKVFLFDTAYIQQK
ncbi:hypothetical protein QQ41_00955 [Streptococcus equi subsp. zooepidemicus]|nr:hypothetical protein QQ41_00955 [Streptococcus equi subsp. zooepidemicus]